MGAGSKTLHLDSSEGESEAEAETTSELNIGWRKGQPPRSDVVVKFTKEKNQKLLGKLFYLKLIYCPRHKLIFEMKVRKNLKHKITYRSAVCLYFQLFVYFYVSSLFSFSAVYLFLVKLFV